jgi:hypothetical protein
MAGLVAALVAVLRLLGLATMVIHDSQIGCRA